MTAICRPCRWRSPTSSTAPPQAAPRLERKAAGFSRPSETFRPAGARICGIGQITGLDLGWYNDATVLTVCHTEPGERGPVVVLDRLHVIRGTRANPVQLADVESLTEHTSRMYGHAPLLVDPREAVAMAQGLRDRGMTVDDKQLTEPPVGSIGANLHLLLREHRMALPEESDLIDELLNVRLKATGLGGMRLDHDAGNHDDQAMSLGLAALALVEHPVHDLGGCSIPRLLIGARKSVP